MLADAKSVAAVHFYMHFERGLVIKHGLVPLWSMVANSLVMRASIGAQC
jgi:hypothetical protein